MSEEDPFDTPFDDSEEKFKEPSEEQSSLPPTEQYGFDGDTEIIESEDLTKKKKRKKIWLIVIFAIVLPVLLVIGVVVVVVLAILGLMESCCTSFGESCCSSCGESCSESCNQSCGSACDSCCQNSCDSACDSCTCDCGSCSSTITLKETIGTQMKLVQWIFKYIFGIFKF